MPKPFRLQALLDYKRQQEEQQMLVLAACEADRSRACEVLDLLHETEASHLAHLHGLAHAPRLDAFAQRDAFAYLARIEASIALQHNVIAEADERVRESRDALVAILKEKRSLDRLREQHVEDTARETARREALAVDEITSARYARGIQAQGRA